LIRQLVLPILLIAGFILPARATHIVGGEMTYTCLGNNQYEITLTIFRDCFYGNPNAWFDNPASIGVFNSSNQLLFEILVPLMNNDTLNPVLSDECLVVPPWVCVHTTTYRTTAELPPIIGGYQLAYQRCCRNQTILNIVDPLATGATYGVTITEQALLECNSSAKFQQWPPLFICVNEPIIFDQSAIDPDGDSIVYKLCAPWQGANQAIPQPQPPNPPPYQPVVWVNPPYGVNNMLNGAPGGEPLSIDLHTGLLTGLPNTIGQFVVGICIEEYRNGVLISTTRRDFQYNVGVCGQAAAAFFTPDIQCGNFTVQVQNQSLGANSYLWYFNDPNNPGAVSTAVNPGYTYADTGRYTITLIVDPGLPCQDTFEREIYLQDNSLFPDFDYTFTACSDSLTIQVTDLTIDTVSSPVFWQWELTPSGQTSNLQNPVFYATGSGTFTLSLKVEAANGCVQTFEQTFPVQLIEEELEEDSLALCSGGAIMLNPQHNSAYQYHWSPELGLSNPFSPNPLASPAETTIYTVTITDADDFCQIEQQIKVVIPEAIEIYLPPDTVICSPDILLQAESNTGVQYYWATDSLFVDLISLADTAFVTPFGPTAYYVLVRDNYGCFNTSEVLITGNGINVAPGGNPIVCEGDLAAAVVVNLDTADTLSFNWQPSDQVLFYGNTAAAVVQPAQSGATTFYVSMENQFGCTAIDSVIVTVIDTSSQLAFISDTQCSGYTVNFNSSSINASYYVWHFGDPAAPGASGQGAATSHTYAAAGDYTVMVTLAPGLPCPDTLLRTISVGQSPVNVDFTWSYESCTDTAVIQFTDLSANSQSDITGWQWNFGNGQTADIPNPSLVLQSGAILPVTLVISSANGCVDTLQRQVVIPLIEANPADTVIACAGEAVGLYPGANPSYSYQWSPPGLLTDPTAANPLVILQQTTVFTTTITDAQGACEVTRTVTAVAPPALTAAVPADTIVCEPTVTLQAQSEQAAFIHWFDTPALINPIGVGASATVMPGRPSTYYIRFIDDYGCVLVDSVSVGSYAISVLLEGATTICIGDTAQLLATNLTGDALTYNWSPLEGIIAGENTYSPLVSPSVSTTYQLSVSNAYGCSLDTGVVVNIFNYVPPVSAFAEPDTLATGESSQLTAEPAEGYTYLWSPAGTLDNSLIPNPVATPLETTTYKVTVRDPSGCINSALVTIVVFDPVCREPNIYVPNGFSPNGDGLNEILYVRGNAIDEMYFAIYNRWGEKVFESRSPEVGWDGTFRGKLLEPEVFGYFFGSKLPEWRNLF